MESNSRGIKRAGLAAAAVGCCHALSRSLPLSQSSAFAAAPSRGLVSHRGSLAVSASSRVPQAASPLQEAFSLVPFLCGAVALAVRGASTRNLRGRGSIVRRAGQLAEQPRSTSIQDNIDWSKVSEEWEIDCFSRPVVKDGKKLWELLLTDANGVYRRVAQMKPTRVNSIVVQKLLQIFVDEAKVKPKVIRFYRKVMKNMLTVAIKAVVDSTAGLDTEILPSRNCQVLRLWLSYREKEVYPKMPGFSPSAIKKTGSVKEAMFQMKHPELPLPLKFPRYIVASIPVAAIGTVPKGLLSGKMCKIPAGLGDSVPVYGVIIISEKAEFLCSVLTTMELNSVRMDIDTNELLMDFGLEETYMVQQVPQEEKESCIEFERQKRELGGLHFVAVHNPQNGDMSLPVEADEKGKGGIVGLWLCMDFTPLDEDQGN